MKRRLLMLATAAALSGRTAVPRAQPSVTPVRRVGVLTPGTRAKDDVSLKSFYDEMRELGWVEGQNIAYDRVVGDDKEETLPRLAGELVARKPDLIVAAPTNAAIAARGATQTIPIVFAVVANPMGRGLVASLARPGGNATGVASNFDPLGPKQMEIVRQLMPDARRIGLLVETGRGPGSKAGIERQMSALGFGLFVAEAGRPVELEAAVARLADQHVDAILNASTLGHNQRALLIALANARRLPVVGASSLMAESGALFSYGASAAAQHRRQAQLVDKVLRGANPAEMPVEQPTQFELVINVRAAKAFGITVPQSLLLRADEVIE